MSCEHCLTRRAFVARSSILVAAAALLDACGDGVIGGVTGPNTPGGNPITITIADFPGLATVGQPVRVGDRRAVVRLGASSFLGLSMICTHQQTTTEIQGTQFFCPNHGSRFANDGHVVNGPARTALVELDVQFDSAAGTLTIS